MQLELTLAQASLQVAEEAKVIFLLRLLQEPQKNKVDYPLDLRLVLDRSGSMVEDADGGLSKIEALRKAIQDSVGILRPGKDNICVIVFDDTRQVLVPHQVLRDPAAVKALIGQMAPGGSTHLSSALQDAIEISAQSDALPKVIIFTDGNVNYPSESSEEKSCLVMARQAHKLGIPLSIFGTGIDYNERFLKALAEAAGRGSYYEHVRQTGMVRLRLAEDLENLKSVQDRDIEVRVEVGSNVKILEATKYVPQQADLPPSGQLLSDSLQGLDVRGQSYLVRTQIKNQGAKEGDFEVGTITVSWRSIAGRETRTLPVVVNFSVNAPVDKTVLKTVLNTEGVKATLAGKIDQAKTLFTKADNPDMVEQLKTIGAKDEDAKRTLRTVTATEAHKGTIVGKDNKGGTK